MRKTLIYYKPEYLELAKKIQENYAEHRHEADVVSEAEQDDVEYARKMHYDEAIFIEDEGTVIIHDVKTWHTERLPVSDVLYAD
jgi:hypothetical protein